MKTYFQGNKKITLKRSEYHEQTLREIIFLIYLELGSKEIADILCFSKRTIDKYREHIFEQIGTRNTVGIIKYAIENGINKDPSLKMKFENYSIEN